MTSDKIVETVNRFFIAVDNLEWKSVIEIFDRNVLLDYTSMTGGEPSVLTGNQIVDAWSKFLPGFDKTHHQLGNYIANTGAETANLFCYGTASHYLANESHANVWTVIGSYEIKLVSKDQNWRIAEMKFNLKFIDGNNDLPKLAKEKLKQ